jgi:hypothetical protein
VRADAGPSLPLPPKTPKSFLPPNKPGNSMACVAKKRRFTVAATPDTGRRFGLLLSPSRRGVDQRPLD